MAARATRSASSSGAAGPGAAGLGVNALREAALAHLARFAASEAGLIRVLERRIQRWGRRAAEAGDDPETIRQCQQQARLDLRQVVAELMRLGVIDDTVFAESRARALTRGGRSARAIAAHLAHRGVDAERIALAVQSGQSEAFDDIAETEYAAALLQARKRRLGPFGASPPDGDEPAFDGKRAVEEDAARRRPTARQRALAALARAGFSHEMALRALDTDLETAEALIAKLRSG